MKEHNPIPTISDFEMTPCIGRCDEERDAWLKEEIEKVIAWQKTEKEKVLAWQKDEIKKINPFRAKAIAARAKANALKEKANVAFAKAIRLNEKAKKMHEKLEPKGWFTRWVYISITGHKWKPFVPSPGFDKLKKDIAELNKEAENPGE